MSHSFRLILFTGLTVLVVAFENSAEAERPVRALPSPSLMAVDSDHRPRSLRTVEAPPPGATDAAGREVVVERYPNRTVKIQRSVKQDAERNYVNDGPWTMFGPQGKVLAQGEFVAGERHGQWMRTLTVFAGAETSFRAPFISQAQFEKGKLNGTWTVVDSQQRIVGSWEFKDGVLDGTATLWYPGGQQSQEMTFVKGVPDGEAQAWKSDGNLFTRQYYREGKQLVPVVTWYDKQQKESEGWMVRSNFAINANIDWWEGIIEVTRDETPGEDRRIGKWMEWYPNGAVRYAGNFENGRPTGDHTWWHENGQRMLAGVYDEGERDGRWTKWHPNGLKEEEGEYLAGAKDGTWTLWSSSGAVAHVEEHLSEGDDGNVSSLVEEIGNQRRLDDGPQLLTPYSQSSLDQ